MKNPAIILCNSIIQELAAHADPVRAAGQEKYMRNQFSYLGIKVPAVRTLAKAWIRSHPIEDNQLLHSLIRELFGQPQRECHYFAIELADHYLPTQDASFIFFLEELITTQSWWDTVDNLSQLVALHFLRFPSQIKSVTGRWIVSDNFWLQRVAIIFQLHYREKTDADLLFDYILRVADSKEFFLQKAAGWALRQYSKTNPEAVKAFIENHTLASLTVREGLKWVNR